MNNKVRKKYIVFIIGLAIVTFMPEIELLINYYLEFQKSDSMGL